MDAIEVAHGDGLNGSCFNYGFGAHTDWEWIKAAGKVIKKARLTTLLLPGIGTVEDLHRAHDLGVTSVRIATHCTEADIAKQHIEICPQNRHGRGGLPDDEPYDRARAARETSQADGGLRRALRLRHRQRRSAGHGRLQRAHVGL